MESSIIITYRCNFKCRMCNTWKHPSVENQEFNPDLIDKLPGNLKFLNITGGEPFLRSDIDTIIEKAISKSKRVVISTNGYFTERIIQSANRYGNRIGIRISIEGLSATNDFLRGIKNGFDHGIKTLTRLKAMGMKDIGFGITVSDHNAKDMIELYRLAESMDVEFATALTHNSFYFHKNSNKFNAPSMIATEFEKVAFCLLRTLRPKNWFRAYFNMGLSNKVNGGQRPLPCEAGTDFFFVDPYGNVLPCNGSDKPMIMGNLIDQEFNEIWHGRKAKQIRKQVADCTKQCWMIGSASPAMKKYLTVPAKWIIKCKINLIKSNGRTITLNPVDCSIRQPMNIP